MKSQGGVFVAMKMPLVLAIVAAMAGGLSVLAQDNSDVTAVDSNTVLSSLKLSEHDQKRIRDVLQSVPADHKVEVECQTLAPGGQAIRFIKRLTAVNAAGKPDGKEVYYVDWYRHTVRELQFKNGVQHGVEQHFDVESGALLSEIPWEKGKIQGVKRSFHPSGKLANEATYENGAIQGPSRSYSQDGKLIRVVNFVAGKREGEATDYWVDNPDAVERIIPYHKDKVDGVAKAFYLNGKLKWERPFKDNRQHGVEKQYAADGTLERTLYWLNGRDVPAEEYRKQAKE